MSVAPPLHTLRESLSLLKTRRYGTFWVSNLLANLGTWVQQVAQPWLMLSLTDSSFMLGLDAFAMDAPMWALTLLGGQLADRADRRKVIFINQSIQMLCPLLLVGLLLFSSVDPWVIIACSLIVGVTDALSMPSFSTMVPLIVEKHQIGAGIALRSMQFNLSRIVGPALAGLLLTTVGAAACFAVSAASYLPFILVAWLVLPRFVPAPSPAPRPPLLRGVREVLTQPRLRGAVATALTTGLFCSPLITFVPVLVRDGFGAGPDAFSAALAGFGAGGLLGGGLLLALEGRFDRRAVSSYAGVAYGALVLLAGLTPWLWSVPALLGLGGLAMSLSNTQANSLLQVEAGERRGQAASLFMLAMRGGLAVGALLTGTLASLLDIHWALALNGAVALLAHLFIGRRWLTA